MRARPRTSSPSSGASREQLPRLSASPPGRPRPGRSRARAGRCGVIALQYNPDTLTPHAAGAGDAARRRRPLARRCGCGARRSRRSSSRPRSTRPTGSSDPDAEPATPSSSASTRSSPRSRRSSTRAPTTSRRTTRWPRPGVLEVLPLEAPLTLFVWSRQRVVPGPGHRPVDHRGGLRRRRSTRSGRRSASACASSRSTTSASTTAAARCSWATCGPRRRWPARAGAVALSALGTGGDLT